MSEISKRIESLRNLLGLTQAQFADALGISRGYVASLEIGNKVPSKLLVKAICREFFIREEWLEKGEGPMRPSPEELIRKCMAVYGVQPVLQALRDAARATGNTEMLEVVLRLDELELHQMLSWLTETYRNGDPRTRTWLAVQFERAFPDFKEDLLKKQGKPGERPEAAAAGDIG